MVGVGEAADMDLALIRSRVSAGAVLGIPHSTDGVLSRRDGRVWWCSTERELSLGC